MARHVTSGHVRRVEPVELVVSSMSNRAVRQARHSKNAWARHVEPRRTCRVVSRRDVTSQVEFGLTMCLCIDRLFWCLKKAQVREHCNPLESFVDSFIVFQYFVP